MGWRERDYARLRDDERRALFGAGPSGNWRARRSSSALMLAVAVSAVATFVGHQYFRFPLHLPARAGTSSARMVTPAASHGPVYAASAELVSIRWRPSDIAPAATAGRICISTAARGRLCATYVAGEKPADTLTRRLESLGLRVQSSG